MVNKIDVNNKTINNEEISNFTKKHNIKQVYYVSAKENKNI